MARYIDAEKLEKHFKEKICQYEAVINGQSYSAFLVDHVLREIRNTPDYRLEKEMGCGE